MRIHNQTNLPITFVIASPPEVAHIDYGFWLVENELAPGAVETWSKPLPKVPFLLVIQIEDNQMNHDDVDLDGATDLTVVGQLPGHLTVTVVFPDRSVELEECD